MEKYFRRLPVELTVCCCFFRQFINSLVIWYVLVTGNPDEGGEALPVV